MRLQQHGFAAAEAPPLPVGQREHKGKGAVRCVGVQPLVAAAHVAAALGAQGEWSEGEECCGSNQLAAEPVGSSNERAPPSSPSHRHHRPCHRTHACPPVHQHPSPRPHLSQIGEMPRQPSSRSPYAIRASSSWSYKSAGKKASAGVRSSVYCPGTYHQSQQKRSTLVLSGSPSLRSRSKMVRTIRW